MTAVRFDRTPRRYPFVKRVHSTHSQGRRPRLALPGPLSLILLLFGPSLAGVCRAVSGPAMTICAGWEGLECLPVLGMVRDCLMSLRAMHSYS